MVTRFVSVAVAAVALLGAAPACKKDNAKPDPSALGDAAGAPVRPADAAPTAAVTPDAGKVATTTADAGAKSTPPGADAGARTNPSADKPKNLKVLPKTWDTAKVNDYMKKQVSRGLGVKCDVCHVKDDYASDTNKKKLAARKMIALTDGLNRDFFKKKPTVTCFTCHKGKEEPAAP
jgi:hypothetical protein